MELHGRDGRGPKHTLRANQDFFEEKEWNVLQFLSPTISPAEGKREGKIAQEQAESEDSWSEELAEHHQGGNPASGDVYQFQTCFYTVHLIWT